MAFECCCCKPNGDFIANLQSKKELVKFEEEFKDQPHLQDMALKLRIKETGSLLLDPNVTHPFVRVHVIDMSTCMYMAKHDQYKPGCYNRESA